MFNTVTFYGKKANEFQVSILRYSEAYQGFSFEDLYSKYYQYGWKSKKGWFEDDLQDPSFCALAWHLITVICLSHAWKSAANHVIACTPDQTLINIS